jgi:hypothetical protein
VNPPRPGAPAGLIGSGVINGRHWRVTLTGSGRNLTATAPGLVSLEMVTPFAPSKSDAPVALNSLTTSSLVTEVGTLRADATVVTVRLANGTLLTVRPVVYHGVRWVAVVVSARLAVTDVVAYGRAGELAHAVPFRGDGTIDEITAWLRPGQPGLRRASVRVGAGTLDGQRWSVLARAGPWGVCLAGSPESGACYDSPAGLVSSAEVAAISECGPFGQGRSFTGFAVAMVRSLRLTLSDGSPRRLRPVELDGTRFFAFAVSKGVHLIRWRAHSAAGRQLRTGSGWGSCS